MSAIVKLILELAERNIRIFMEDGKLKIGSPGDEALEALLPEIKQHKEELIAYLSARREKEVAEILPAAARDAYPLSSSQHRLWIISRLEGASMAYNMPGTYLMEGRLDYAALEYAFRRLIERHESLRTIFRETGDGRVQQVVLPPEQSSFAISYTDIRNDQDPAENVRSRVLQESSQPFDLCTGPLLRAGVYRLADSQWILNCTLQHIISDGWSVEVLIRELAVYYNTFLRQEASPLQPLRIQYKDYAVWQQEYLGSEQMKAHKAWWLKNFEGPLPVLEFPCDKARPLVKTYHGDVVSRRISRKVTDDIKNISLESGCTLFMGLLAAVNVLLYRYTGQEDLIIGAPVAGRDQPGLEDQIGVFVNTLALRCRFSGDEDFSSLLERVKQVTLDAYKRQAYPFDELVEELSLQRDRSRNPLFDVMVVMQQAGALSSSGRQALEGLSLQTYTGAAQVISKFDLLFSFTETTDGLLAGIEYNSDLFNRSSIEQLSRHLEQMLACISRDPATPVKLLNYLDTEEIRSITALNDIPASYPTDKTLVMLLEEQAATTAEHIALVAGNTRLNYRQLNEAANQLGHYLRRQYDIRPNDLVAVCLEKSEWMIIVLLGILKAGGAYVPMDPDYPRERIDSILNDCRCKVLIDEAFLLAYRNSSRQYSSENLPWVNHPGHLAYVIYTSGTTGLPKGTLISHENVVQLMKPGKPLFDFGASDVWALFHSYCFDVSVWEMYGALLFGGSLVVVPPQTARDPAVFLQLLLQEKVTVLNQTPTAFYNLLLQEKSLPGAGVHLRYIIFAGEALNPAKLEDWKKRYPDTELINMYGITETTVLTTFKRITPEDIAVNSQTIGRPLQALCCYVMDQNLQLLPPGVWGELLVGGKGVAQGYLDREELTRKKFIKNPFKENDRLYRSGDKARLLANGEIEFGGRMDHQVKIHGFRIEPAEIEHALQSHPAIETAVVITRTDSQGDIALVAYITAAGTLHAAGIRSFLAKKLPSWMIPGYFVQLDQWPLTVNGKIDRAQLPDPVDAAMQTGMEYVAPRNTPEQQLIAVIEEVLKKQPVSLKDDFFVMGGDSIKAIQVISRLKQRSYVLTLQEIMQYPVMEDLAREMKPATRIPEQAPVEGMIPLSPIQHYFFEQKGLLKDHFNQSILLSATSRLSDTGIRLVLDKIMLHHDALRMVFRETVAGWMQENKGPGFACSLEVIEVANDQLMAVHCNHIQESMRLEDGPLLKAVLFHQPEADLLLLAAHHLVIDAVSWRILAEDLSLLYRQYLGGIPLELPLKTDSFLHWQQQQLSYAAGSILQLEESYWSRIDTTAVCALPLDFPAGSNRIKDQATAFFQLDETLTAALLTQCYKAYRTEINDILLTAFSMVLNEVFDLAQVPVWLEGHGREYIGADMDVSRTVGWFTSLYPVVFDMQYIDHPMRQLIAVKEQLRSVPGKGIGYGILRYLSGRAFKQEPGIIFNYLGELDAQAATPQDNIFRLSHKFHGHPVAMESRRNVLLEVSGFVKEGRLQIEVMYSARQFAVQTMDRLMELFRHRLTSLVKTLAAERTGWVTPADLSYKELEVEQVLQLSSDHNLEDICRLSPLQQGLYHYWSGAPGSSDYFIQMSYRLQGPLEKELLEKSYQLLVSRHAILRTRFTNDYGDTLLQLVSRQAEGDFTWLAIPGLPEFSVEAFRESDRAKGFNLHGQTPMRLTVLDLGDHIHEFIWSHHHILLDGWCVGILFREFFQIYHCLQQNRQPDLPPVYPYSSYISWLENTDRNSSMQYWKDYLQGYDAMTSLPSLTGDAGIREKKIRTVKYRVDGPLRQSIRTLCAALSVTESTFIQAAWGMLLGRYNDTDDVVFGMVISGRPAALKGVEDMVGLFSNTIPVRVSCREGMTASELLKNLQQQAVESAAHHYVQLAEIQAEARNGRSLFDHILVFQNFPVDEIIARSVDGSQGLNFISADVFDETHYDLVLTAFPGNEIIIEYDYNTALYDAQHIQRIHEQLMQVMAQLALDPGKQAAGIDYLSMHEKQQLLVDFNDTGSDYPSNSTIAELFTAQAKQTPDNIAIVFEHRSLTYRQLDEQSDKLAAYLHDHCEVTPDEGVGILLERSERLLIAILGILKAGAAYVPIDPAFPHERIDYILKDTAAAVLITESDFLFQLHHFSGTLFAMDVQMDGLADCSKPPAAQVTPRNLAYVLYTSGSTGTPRGVMIEQRSVIRLVKSAAYVSLRGNEVLLSTGAVSFDATTFEYWSMLLNGGRLVLCSRQVLMDAQLLAAEMKKNSVSIMWFTAGWLNQLVDGDVTMFSGLRTLLAGGDRLSAAHIKILKAHYPELQIINGYGPTENTTFSLCYTIPAVPDNIPVGKPISNSTAYILDKRQRLCAIGVAGEICTGGAGIARGYLNNDTLTDQKFIPHPFVEGEKIYRTGDLGRWLPDGNIEFLGRMDDQVKIRGYRVEPGETAAMLQRHPLISEAVVTAGPDQAGEKVLTAYFVSGENLDPAMMHEYLGRSLPDYMLPAFYVQLDALPLTANGKVDKKRLPLPDAAGMQQQPGYEAPAGKTEETLVAVWQEILGRNHIGVTDNFFELGGHSLNSIKLIARIKKDFNVNYSIEKLFRKPTIREVADELEKVAWVNPELKEMNNPVDTEMYSI